MSDFINFIVSILDITLTVGTVSISLGGVVLGMVIMKLALSFFSVLSEFRLGRPH